MRAVAIISTGPSELTADEKKSLPFVTIGLRSLVTTPLSSCVTLLCPTSTAHPHVQGHAAYKTVLCSVYTCPPIQPLHVSELGRKHALFINIRKSTMRPGGGKI